MKKKVRTLIGLIFAFGFPCMPLSDWLLEFKGTYYLVHYELVWWAATIGLLVYARAAEKITWQGLGFVRLKKWDWLWTIGTAAITVVILGAVYLGLLPALGMSEDSQVNTLMATPLWWRIISTVRAAVAEEVFYRGYGLQRVEALSGKSWLGGSLSCVLFTLAHVPTWGWIHVVPALIGGTILTLLFLKRRNLWVNIGCHFLVDLTAILAG